jgi:hypothetical protein
VAEKQQQRAIARAAILTKRAASPVISKSPSPAVSTASSALANHCAVPLRIADRRLVTVTTRQLFF